MIELSGRNLCFLVSTPRAGSTVLGAMLGSLPGVVCPPEPWVQLLLGSLDRAGPETETVYDHRLALEAIAEFAPEELRYDSIRRHALALYNDVLARNGGTLLVDKTPRYYHILGHLAQLWPEARFVWVRRNPLDVVASCKDTWNIPVSEQMGDVVTPHSYDTTFAFAQLRRFFQPTRTGCIAISYEDLVSKPETTMQAVCAMLGLPFEPQMVEYGRNQPLVSAYRSSSFGDKKTLEHSKPHRSSIGQWQTRLTKEDVRLVLETLGANCFGDQGYETELKQACRACGLDPATLAVEGTWADKLQRSNWDMAAGASGSPFRGMRLVTQQLREIEELRSQVANLSRELRDVCADRDEAQNRRNLLTAQLAELQSNFDAAENDRLARGKTIEDQGLTIAEREAEIDRLLKELQQLFPQIDQLKNERNLIAAQLTDLRSNFDAAEVDRLARGRTIEAQGRKIAEHEAEIDRLLKELQRLFPEIDQLKNDRNLVAAQLADLTANFSAAEADRLARGRIIELQGHKIAEYEAEIDRRLNQLQELYPELERLKNERNLFTAQLSDAQARLRTAEADRHARGEVIEAQGQRIAAHEREINQRLAELSALYRQADELRNEGNYLRAQLKDLEQQFAAVERDRADRLQVIIKQGEIVARREQAIVELEQKAMNAESECAELRESIARGQARPSGRAPNSNSGSAQ